MRTSMLPRLLAAGALLLAACGDDTAPTPTATASPEVTATQTATATPTATATSTAGATPEGTVLPDVAAELDAIGEAVEGLRGIEPDQPVERHLVSPDELRDVVEEGLADERAIASIDEEERLYTLLGLMPPAMDLDQVQRELLGDQVLGLYDPETDEFYVRADGEFDVMEETTYAHEYVHFLQDEAYDLEAMQEAASGNRDRSLALTTLIEGDATRVQLQYMQQFVDPRDLLGLLFTAQLPPADTPAIVLELLQFPYLGGAEFTGSLPDVDAAFRDPPLTTEQVLHPEKFAAREPALAVTLPALTSTLGEGWTVEDDDHLGELFVRSWLGAMDAEGAGVAAAGWGGDAVTVLTGPGDASALAVLLAWDDPQVDGGEFVAALRGALDADADFAPAEVAGAESAWEGPGGVLALASTPEGVALVVGPDAAAAEALLRATVEGASDGR